MTHRNQFIKVYSLLCLSVLCIVSACKQQSNPATTAAVAPVIPEGMVWVPKGSFYQGAAATDTLAMQHEKPRHAVLIDSFLIDKTEVTNAQFQQFVAATGYITLAERAVDWESLREQVPPGTPKPHDSLLQPGSLIFRERTEGVANLYDFSQWWSWKIGANWKHPQGPTSTLEGKAQHPVVHIAYEDALAYCRWAGRTLPTEAQWEYAARAGSIDAVYTWGDDPHVLSQSANTYTGMFPVQNDQTDGYSGTAPVASYPPNALGIYDMAGNVWEWTQDWYVSTHYQTVASQQVTNPQGAPRNPHQPPEKVIKGGSFLCNATYCASYRITARMGNSLDSSSEHKGFRTVINIQ